MSVKLLTEHHFGFLSLKGGCTGSSESTLVKMPHCWKAHVADRINSHKIAEKFINKVCVKDLTWCQNGNLTFSTRKIVMNATSHVSRQNCDFTTMNAMFKIG